MTAQMHRQGLGYWATAAAFCAIWGFGFPVCKLVLQSCPPETFLGIRFFLSGAAMLGWAFWRGYLASPVPWVALGALGLVNFGMSNGFAWWGMKTVSAGTTVIVIAAVPVVIGIVGALLLGDRLRPLRALGLALGLGGVGFVVRNRIAIGGEDAFGIGMVGLSVISQSAGTILFKRWSPRLPLTVVVGGQQVAAGVVLLLVGALFEDVAHIKFDGTFWWGIAFMTLLNSIVSFQLWFFMLSRYSATSVASLQFVMPPLGLLSAWDLLREPISLLDLVGLIPIAVGIWLASRTDPPADARPSLAASAGR